MDPWTFWLGGALTLGSGLLMVTRRNAVSSVMWLVAAFLGMSVLFFGMGAPLVGVLQVLVYVGAIVVLFLFVIMLLNLTPSGLTRIDRPRLKLVGMASALVFVGLVAGVASASVNWNRQGTADAIRARTGKDELLTSSALTLSDQLFNEHLLAFEVASVLLLVAIIGAVTISKKRL